MLRMLTAPPTSLLRLIRRRPIAALVVLTLGLTWLLEIPRVLDARGELPFPFPFPLVILMGWMPGVAAIIVAAASGGRAVVRTLFARLLIWKVGWSWYLLVVGGTAAIWLTSVAINPVFGGSGLQVPEFTVDVLIGLVINFVLLFLVNAEELVWRGSMLPRLQARWSALVASVVIGVLEGLFHLPLFFQPNSDQAATGLPVFMVGSIAGAIIFSWLFNNTSGSLLLVQLFHIFASVDYLVPRLVRRHGGQPVALQCSTGADGSDRRGAVRRPAAVPKACLGTAGHRRCARALGRGGSGLVRAMAYQGPSP